MVTRSRLKKKKSRWGDVITINKHPSEITKAEVTTALMKTGRVLIKSPDFDKAVKEKERKHKKS